MTDDEVAEILSRSDKLQEADSTLSADAAATAAVRGMIAELRGEPAATTTPDPFAGLTGEDPRKAITDRIAAETHGGFKTKVDAAVSAGDISRNHGDTLIGMAAADARGMSKAKDELIRLREKAAQTKAAEKEAGKSWNDADFNWQEGDPKWDELSQNSKTKWTDAVAQNKANGELYEQIVAETKVVASMPQADTAGDVQTARNAQGAILNPDIAAEGNQKIDGSLADMKQGSTAAAWLAKNGSTPFIRDVAARIAAVIDKDLPITISATRAPTDVLALFAGTAEAVSRVANDGTGSLYFKTEPDEVTMLHELLHAATQRGLIVSDDAALLGELRVLVSTVQRSLRGIRDEAVARGDSSTYEDAAFFESVVKNPDELFAYGFSSPSLRKLLQQFNWDGNRKGLGDEQWDDRVRRNADDMNLDGAKLSLWDRFTDWIRNLLGVEKKNAKELANLIDSINNEREAYLTERLTPSVYKRLDALLARALTQQAATPPARMVEATLAPITSSVPRGQSSTEAPNVPKGFSIPDFEPSSRLATTLKDWTGGWRTQPWMLGWLTLRQIADRFKDVPGVASFADLSSKMGAKAKSLMQEAHEVDKTWQLLKSDDMNEMQRLMLESTMEQIWPNRPFQSQTHLDQTSLALRQKHAQFVKRYNGLSENARKTYEHAQAKMRKDWDERGRLLKKKITDQYRAELHHAFAGDKLDALANANKGDRAKLLEGLSRLEKKSAETMLSDLDTHAERLAQMQGPYFPLNRFGEHVVVAKSNDLNAAADAFADARDRLEALNADDDATPEQIKKARDAVAKTQAEVEGFKDNEKHYIVEFYESPSEARARQEQLVQHFAGQGTPMAVYTQRREEHFAKVDAVSPGFMKKLQDSLSATLPEKDANAIRAAVRDLYIQSMPERSALKSQLRRIGVKGVKENEMRRGFAASAMRSSWHLSRLQYGDDMMNHLNDLRTGDTDEQKIVGGELTRRMAATFQQDTSNVLIDRLTNLSYLTYLGMSPSFFVINAMQPWTISLPVMAARHGIGRSTAELGKAFTEVAAAMKNSAVDQKTWRFELNLEEFKDLGERKMLEDLFNKGVIDVTIEHDLGSLAGGQEDTRFGKVMALATLPAHHTEVINRVMTALAAYRLETKGGLGTRSSAEQATKYAEQVVADTHLDYTPENAPRFMRSASLGGLGRIVFQFKKYMQGMIFLMGKQVQDAARGDKEQAKAFAYLMGMQLATAGAAGLPFAAPIGVVAAAVGMMYPDDDKPEFYQLLYRGMRDVLGDTGARLLMKGAPAALGADISSRVGFGNILNPLAFVPSGKEGAEYVAAATMALAGPAVSMMANWAEGLVIAKDDPLKAAQRAFPKFLADPLRAIDRANRGVTNRRGETLIPAEEFGPLGIMMRATGFESSQVTDMYDERNAFMRAKKERDDARARLIRVAAAARTGEGDTADAQERIDAFNERHPDNRIKGSTISSAIKAKRITAQELKEGVRVRKNDRALAESLGIPN